MRRVYCCTHSGLSEIVKHRLICPTRFESCQDTKIGDLGMCLLQGCIFHVYGIIIMGGISHLKMRYCSKTEFQVCLDLSYHGNTMMA